MKIKIIAETKDEKEALGKDEIEIPRISEYVVVAKSTFPRGASKDFRYSYGDDLHWLYGAICIMKKIIGGYIT